MIDTNKLKGLENYEILHFDLLDSTNTFAKNEIKNGKKNQFIVIANEQTNGKGRMGRKFYSDKNSGLYFSIVKKDINKNFIHLLTVLTASAILKVLDEMTNKKFFVKWVNDIFINKKKICGILVENVINPSTKKIDYSVIGIGINLFGEIAEKEIKDIASTVEKETKIKIDENRFIVEVIKNIDDFLESINEKSFLKIYKERLLFKNEKITVNDFSKQYEAELIDIDDEARLIVNASGKIKYLNSGEVTTKTYS